MLRRAIVFASVLLMTVQAAGGEPDMEKALADLQSQSAETSFEAAKFVLTHSERAPSPQLLIASAVALERGPVADAAFLFFAGQLRARADLDAYPPKGKGGDSPAVALGALSNQIGMAVNPAIMKEPKALRAVVARIAEWVPATPRGFDPGWESGPANLGKGSATFLASREDFLKRYRGLVTLLENAEYFAAFRTVQDFNLESTLEEMQDPARIKARENAEKKMLAIETKLGIEGIFYRKPQ